MVDEYFDLPVAFQFLVKPLEPMMLAESILGDNAFSEVSGIEATMEVDKLIEGGENRFAHQLPLGVSHSNLVLKRGIAPKTSFIVQWCQAVFNEGLNQPIETTDLEINLLDAKSLPLRSWTIYNAFPVKWQVDSFNSTKNEMAIEQIELSYNYYKRTV